MNFYITEIYIDGNFFQLTFFEFDVKATCYECLRIKKKL